MTDTTHATAMTMPRFLRHLKRLGACSEAVTWAEVQPDPETLWRECHRGDWLLWLAARANVRRQDIVLAACACARLALPHVRAGEERPRIAIETAERLARGEGGVTVVDVRSAAADAYAAARVAADAAALAAADAAYAYAYAYADTDAAAYAALAADAAALAAAATRQRVLRECADLVRARILWPTVAAALETRR